MKPFPTPQSLCYVMLDINRNLSFIYLILNPLFLMPWDVSPAVYVNKMLFYTD